MTLKEMQLRAWETSNKHGFHCGQTQLNIPSKLMLIVSELSEALEEHRDDKPICYFTKDKNGNNKPEGISAELADAVIRIGDLAGIIGFDLEAAVKLKMDYNDTREHMHGRSL